MILAVNTGSFCGFAGQHGGLTFVHDNYTIHRYVTRVESYSNRTAPDSRTLVAHIERWLT